MSDELSLFAQLKKRHVFRVGAMYIVGAWVLLQFGEIMIDLMDLPRWTGRALVVLLALGFPFILILAWVFDISTKGLVRGSGQVDAKDHQIASRKIDLAIIVTLVVALALSFFMLRNPIEIDDDSSLISVPDLVATPIFDKTRDAYGDQYILVGNLVDFTGSSGDSGQTYGQAIIDSANWINENGGINGKLIDLDTIETSYLVRRALRAFDKWSTENLVAIQGWGTGIGIALKGQVTKNNIPYFSASYAAEFTDPLGVNTDTPAPYNFFYGPSYSDGCRGLVQWAREDWLARTANKPAKFIHMGDNQPYPNAPKDACEVYATSLGFEILPSIVFSMVPGDFSRQCAMLKASEADYVFLANLDKSVSSLLTQCQLVGVKTQYMANIWGFDESVMRSAGIAADGVVWVMGAAAWPDTHPGMYTVREVSKMSDPEQSKYRPVHYMRGVCSMFYLKEAMEIAEQSGTLSGPSIKSAMYLSKDWVPEGLEGVCLPATWSNEDHRGIARVLVYRALVREEAAGRSMETLIDLGVIHMQQIYEANIPRKPEWLGY